MNHQQELVALDADGRLLSQFTLGEHDAGNGLAQDTALYASSDSGRLGKIRLLED